MNAYYDDEVAELEGFDDFAERLPFGRTGRRFPSLPVPRPGNVVPPTPSARPVTRTEFTNAVRRLDEKISVNSRAIKTIEGRINAVAEANTRQDRQIQGVQGEVKSLREVTMLLPLLSQGDDAFSKLLPMLLLSGGLPGSGNTDSSSAMGGMMLPLILLLATQK